MTQIVDPKVQQLAGIAATLEQDYVQKGADPWEEVFVLRWDG